MGLDMAIIRVSNPHKDPSVIYKKYDIEGVTLNEDDAKDPKFQQLLPYTQQLQIRRQDWDLEKIKKDYGLSNDAHVYMVSQRGIAMSDGETRVEISNKDLEEKYTVELVETCHVCETVPFRNWRKESEIQEWFHNHLECAVESTGMYILSLETLCEFNKAFPEENLPAIQPDEERALYYWEWC